MSSGILRQAIEYANGIGRAGTASALANLALKVETKDGDLTPDEVRILSVIKVLEEDPEEAESWLSSIVRWHPSLQPIVDAIAEVARDHRTGRPSTRH